MVDDTNHIETDGTTCTWLPIAYMFGRCGKPAIEGVCAEHRAKKCFGCGERAKRECSYEGRFVCGYLICDNCEHVENPAPGQKVHQPKLA